MLGHDADPGACKMRYTMKFARLPKCWQSALQNTAESQGAVQLQPPCSDDSMRLLEALLLHLKVHSTSDPRFAPKYLLTVNADSRVLQVEMVPCSAWAGVWQVQEYNACKALISGGKKHTWCAPHCPWL